MPGNWDGVVPQTRRRREPIRSYCPGAFLRPTTERTKNPETFTMHNTSTFHPQPSGGAQRLSVERLDAWRSLEYGMMLHYGLGTFCNSLDEAEKCGANVYQPTALDVDQWVQVARDAGMRYIMVTAKHLRTFPLWHTDTTDFHVGNSPVPTDIIDELAKSCDRHGLKMGLYYFGGDTRELLDEQFRHKRPHEAFVTAAFTDWCCQQLTELLTRYGHVEEVWFDGPQEYGPQARRELYDHVASVSPDTVIAMNTVWETNGTVPVVKPEAWPTDVLVIESAVPPFWGRSPWRRLEEQWIWDIEARREREAAGDTSGRTPDYYLPVEATMLCHTADMAWWWAPTTRALTDEELLGMRLLTKTRGASLVLNATPDRRGLIPEDQAQALARVASIVDNLKQ